MVVGRNGITQISIITCVMFAGTKMGFNQKDIINF